MTCPTSLEFATELARTRAGENPRRRRFSDRQRTRRLGVVRAAPPEDLAGDVSHQRRAKPIGALIARRCLLLQWIGGGYPAFARLDQSSMRASHEIRALLGVVRMGANRTVKADEHPATARLPNALTAGFRERRKRCLQLRSWHSSGASIRLGMVSPQGLEPWT